MAAGSDPRLLLAEASRASERAMANFIRMTRAIVERQTVFVHRPSFLEFSWNTACNLRCRMCSHSEDEPIERAPAEAAAAFLDEVLPTASMWTPSANSEPLLNDLEEVVRLCARHHVFLVLYTNAMLLTPEVYDSLAPWLHALTLSVDSHDPAVLESLRVGVRMERLRPHLEHAVRRSAELGISCGFNTVLMVETVTHFPDFVDWVADLGRADIQVLELLHNAPRAPQLDAVRVLGIGRVNELLRAMEARAKARKVNLCLLLPEPLFNGDLPWDPRPERATTAAVIDRLQGVLAVETAGFCPQLGWYLKVEPSGATYPCCRAPRELLLGNVFDQGFAAVWNGTPAQRLRAAHHAGKVPWPCRGCLIREDPMLTAGGRSPSTSESK